MEGFSLLKYWRGFGGGGGPAMDGGANVRTVTSRATTTIATALSHQATETEDDDDQADDGPFFDLLPGDGGELQKSNDVKYDGRDCEIERELNFTFSSGSSSEAKLSLSPSDDLFFPTEPAPPSIVLHVSEPIAKPPSSLLKSATKFSVLNLKFKKAKANSDHKTDPAKSEEKSEDPNRPQSKHFTVKLKVEEVPIMSIFSRDNSSRGSNKSQKQKSLEESAAPSDAKESSSTDSMQRYLKMVKPLYVRVSKRYGEKLKLSGQLSLGGTKTEPPPAPFTAAKKLQPKKSSVAKDEPKSSTEPQGPSTSNMKSQKQENIPAELRVVRKHLRKSRSASAAVAAAPATGPVVTKRRDDSLLQQEDGIQSAILHCKRSFNLSRDSKSSLLPRSMSGPLHQKSMSGL